jgi:hypothetical protein
VIVRGLMEKLGMAEPTADEPVLREIVREKLLEDVRSPRTQMAIALGKVKREDQLYAGTVPHAEVQRRRERNRRARAARRINRGRR